MRLFAGGAGPGNRPKSNAAVDHQLTRDQGLAVARQIPVMALTAKPVMLLRVSGDAHDTALDFSGAAQA